MYHAYWAHDELSEYNPVHAIQNYCTSHNITLASQHNDPTSNKVHWDKRDIYTLMTHTAKAGDTIVTYDASTLARSALQLIEILQVMARHQLTLVMTKYDTTFTPSETTATQDILSLMLHAESEFVAKRTADALKRRRAAGLPLGRPKGRKNKSRKLDAHREEIIKYLTLNISKASIAKLVGCHAQTLYNYIDDCDLMAADKQPEHTQVHLEETVTA